MFRRRHKLVSGTQDSGCRQVGKQRRRLISRERLVGCDRSGGGDWLVGREVGLVDRKGICRPGWMFRH